MMSVHSCACREVVESNVWLVACSGVHLALAIALVQALGAVGLIIADMANMGLRIAYCLRFLSRTLPRQSLRALFPESATLAALALAPALTLASNALLLGSHSSVTSWALGFGPRAAAHVALGACCLAGVAWSTWRCERQLLRDVRGLRHGRTL